MAWASGGGIRLLVHKEIAPLVALLLDATAEGGYQLDKTPDDWGYANRPITGTTNVPSNHSWGLAVDLNATRNPYGPTLITNMPAWMPELWADYGFRWGGDYTSNKDAMHYEYMGTPEQAKRHTERAEKELGDLAYSEFKDGWKAFRRGDKLPDNATPDFQFGFNAAKFAAPAPGQLGAVVPEHEHPHVHPVGKTGKAQDVVS
jgi:hypothetical protein